MYRCTARISTHMRAWLPCRKRRAKTALPGAWRPHSDQILRSPGRRDAMRRSWGKDPGFGPDSCQGVTAYSSLPVNGHEISYPCPPVPPVPAPSGPSCRADDVPPDDRPVPEPGTQILPFPCWRGCGIAFWSDAIIPPGAAGGGAGRYFRMAPGGELIRPRTPGALLRRKRGDECPGTTSASSF